MQNRISSKTSWASPPTKSNFYRFTPFGPSCNWKNSNKYGLLFTGKALARGGYSECIKYGFAFYWRSKLQLQSRWSNLHVNERYRERGMVVHWLDRFLFRNKKFPPPPTTVLVMVFTSATLPGNHLRTLIDAESSILAESRIASTSAVPVNSRAPSCFNLLTLKRPYLFDVCSEHKGCCVPTRNTVSYSW